MKMAIVGCGLIASRWVRVLDSDPRIQIIALVDPDQAAAAALASKHHLQVPITATLGEALTRADVEAVANLTPVSVHADISRTALKAGLHVLSEKPLTVRLGEATELVRLAQERQRVLAVMQNRGMDPHFASFRDHLHATSGPPYAVTAEVFVPLHTPGFRTGQDLPATTDLAVHAFDQIRQLITAQPRDLQCTETPAPFLGDHCSLTTAIVRFTDGSHFTYRGGFTTGTALHTPATGRWQAEGADGGAAFDGQRTITTTAHSEPVLLPDADPGYQSCLRSMINALHAPLIPDGLAAETLGTIALLDAAITSARSGHMTDVPTTPGPRDRT